jgi:hypothetical protein
MRTNQRRLTCSLAALVRLLPSAPTNSSLGGGSREASERIGCLREQGLCTTLARNRFVEDTFRVPSCGKNGPQSILDRDDS